MPPKTPSMAFEPTPAVDSDKENFPLLDEKNNLGTQDPRLERRPSKEVHFSPPGSRGLRAQSLATTVPYLEPISSASRLPRQPVKTLASEVNINSYMEQSRALLESQRLNFERERKIFETERKLWNAERVILKSRIADLELNLNKQNSGRRRSSNESPTASLQSFWKDNAGQLSTPRSRGASVTNRPQPVWETPEIPVTRVFLNEEQQPQTKKAGAHANGLPSISENGVENPVSPRSVPVPGAMLDSSLDGITLKSAGLESSFVKISSPRSNSRSQTPSPRPHLKMEGSLLRLPLDGLSSPRNANLVRNAGHTPMESGKSSSSTGTTPGVESRRSPEPAIEPASKEGGSSSSTAYGSSRPLIRPSERADSYFSNALDTSIETESASPKIDQNGNGDTELKGPLTMNNKPPDGVQVDKFLDRLDAKLKAEVDRPRTDEVDSNGDTAPTESPRPTEEVDDGRPQLKLKRSMNFGSAFGSNRCGRV